MGTAFDSKTGKPETYALHLRQGGHGQRQQLVKPPRPHPTEDYFKPFQLRKLRCSIQYLFVDIFVDGPPFDDMCMLMGTMLFAEWIGVRTVSCATPSFLLSTWTRPSIHNDHLGNHRLRRARSCKTHRRCLGQTACFRFCRDST